MDVPVILVMPAQKKLRAAAMDAAVDMSAGVSSSSIPKLTGVTLDSRFAPVAVGGFQEGEAFAAAAPAETSSHFALRGHIKRRAGKDFPHEIGETRVFSDPQIRPFLTCGGTPPVGNAATVATKLQVAKLKAKKLEGKKVAIAIVDTGINLAHVTGKIGRKPGFDAAASWQPPASGVAPGAWPVAHGSMCAFDVLIAAPEATLVDFPVLSAHYPGGGSTMSGTLSAALAAYGFMMTSWASGKLKGYQALVASNSWGIFHPSWDFPVGHPGRYCDNPNHPFNIQIAAVTRAGIDVVFAAGNCGAPCADGRCLGRTKDVIMGASAIQEVLTISGCDTSDVRVGYSSQGPSIPGLYPEKPDITGYTHFLGSEAFGANSPDSGTSAACPVVAGCVAALRSSSKALPSTVSTAAFFDALRKTARPRPGSTRAWNGDYGYGIIDPLAAATKLRI